MCLLLRPRLLGFAGLPLLESVPCFIGTIITLARVSWIHQIHAQLHRDVMSGYKIDITTISIRPSTASKNTLQPNPSPHFSSSSSPLAITSSRPPSTAPGPLTTSLLSPGCHSHTNSLTRQFHLPFRSTRIAGVIGLTEFTTRCAYSSSFLCITDVHST